MVSKKDRPIGIFDSGVGGLTVLRQIIRELPDESTIYLGDTARVPYGIRSPKAVIRYSYENIRFLFSKDIKLLVVACNTVSSFSLDGIKSSTKIPVIGVIEPGAKAAVRSTKNKRIGIIGTEATIKSGSYVKSIKAIDKDVSVFGLPCPLFVPLAEEGWTEGDIAIMVAERYLNKIKDKGIDTLILGCTHYPLLKKVISHVMGKDVKLIDSAIEVAQEIRKTLEITGLKRRQKEKPLREFYVTDSPERFVRVGERFLGQKIEHIELISEL